MATLPPGSPGTHRSTGPGDPPGRLPLRWALIVLVTAAVGIACFSTGGIDAAIIAASAVAAALHNMLA